MKKTKNKFFCMVVVALTLAACGGKSAEVQSNEPEEKQLVKYFVYKHKITKTKTIKLYVESQIMSTYGHLIQMAIARWNSLNGGLSFELTNMLNTGVTHIKFGNNVSSIAHAALPQDGWPGKHIEFNREELRKATPVQILYTTMHELTHTIGFRHINKKFDPRRDIKLELTPECFEKESLMRASVAFRASDDLSQQFFTDCDIRAYRKMYPK